MQLQDYVTKNSNNVIPPGKILRNIIYIYNTSTHILVDGIFLQLESNYTWKYHFYLFIYIRNIYNETFVI